MNEKVERKSDDICIGNAYRVYTSKRFQNTRLGTGERKKERKAKRRRETECIQKSKTEEEEEEEEDKKSREEQSTW